MNSKNSSQTQYDKEPVFVQGIAIVQRNGKFGAIMLGGKEIVPLIYDALSKFENGIATAEYNGEKRSINLSGQIQINKEKEKIFLPDNYDWACDFGHGGIRVLKNSKWGILNQKLKLVVPCAYDGIEPICNGLFKYRESDRVGLINIENGEIGKAQYRSIVLCRNGFWKIERIVDDTWAETDRYGIINKKGEEILPTQFSDIVPTEVLGKTVWVVSQSSKKGVYDSDGQCLIHPLFDKIEVPKYGVGSFICTINAIYGGKDTTIKYNIYGENKYGNYINLNTVATVKKYVSVLDSTLGLFRVRQNGKWGILNQKIELVVPPKYAYISEFQNGFAVIGEGEEVVYDLQEIENIKDEYETNLYLQKMFDKKLKCGLIDTTGEVVLSPEYDFLYFKDGYWKCYKDGLCGLISPSLSIVFHPKYKSVEYFAHNLFVVTNAEREKGLIDHCGKEILPFDSFTSIELFGNGLLKLFYERSWEKVDVSIANVQGKIIVWGNNSYYKNDESISNLGNGMILLSEITEANLWSDRYIYNLVNLQGEKILPKFYKKINFLDKGLLSIQGKNGWGIANICGRVRIDTKYLHELIFENDIAKIEVEGSPYVHKINKWGNVIVHNGKHEVELPNTVYWGTDFVNQISIVRETGGREKGRWKDAVGVIDVEGNFVIPTQYKRISLLSNKTFRVYDGNYYGIFTLKGKSIFPPIFTSIEYVAEDRIKVIWNLEIAKEWTPNNYTSGGPRRKVGELRKKNNRSALCNSKGEIVNDKEFLYIGKFVNQYACAYKKVTEEGKLEQVGVIDVSGKTIIPPIYDRIVLYEDSSYVLVRKDGEFGIGHLKSRSIYMPNKMHIKAAWDLDKLGRCIFGKDCQYDYRYNEDYDDWISRWIGGTRGVLSIKGIIVPAGKYHNIHLLDNGLIKVANENDDLYGLLDEQGKEILPIKYSYISAFKGGRATICLGGWRDRRSGEIKDGKWGVIDSTGKFIKDCVSDKEEELTGTYDKKGDDVEVTPFEKPTIILSDAIPEPERNNYDYHDYSTDGDDAYGSCSKYGGYNGYDDFTINEAFDGDPDATWNID